MRAPVGVTGSHRRLFRRGPNWKSQPPQVLASGSVCGPGDCPIENKIADFVQIVRRRNVREAVACLIILPLFAIQLYRHREPTLTTVGMALVVLAVLIIL